jgi:hypothetical protein
MPDGKSRSGRPLVALRRAVLFRDGLMIAVLTYRPLRLKNFAGMRLGHHLMKVGGAWHILLSADETKTRVPHQAVFPSARTPSWNDISTCIDRSSSSRKTSP